MAKTKTQKQDVKQEVKLDLQKQAEEILKIAEKFGVEQNFLFLTTFKRYQVQLNILSNLEKKIKEDGSLVTKEYVKGRENVYTHPAISEYNKTAQSANNTVATLIKILKDLRKEGVKDDKEKDALFEALGVK